MTCDADAGGHYYTGTVTSDPWTSISYTSVSGTTAGVVSVTTGGTGADIEGRAMVIHGYDGGRIACALLTPTRKARPSRAAGFAAYYDYTGPLAVSGSVGPVVSNGVTQSLSLIHI